MKGIVVLDVGFEEQITYTKSEASIACMTYVTNMTFRGLTFSKGITL